MMPEVFGSPASSSSRSPSLPGDAVRGSVCSARNDRPRGCSTSRSRAHSWPKPDPPRSARCARPGGVTHCGRETARPAPRYRSSIESASARPSMRTASPGGGRSCAMFRPPSDCCTLSRICRHSRCAAPVHRWRAAGGSSLPTTTSVMLLQVHFDAQPCCTGGCLGEQGGGPRVADGPGIAELRGSRGQPERRPRTARRFPSAAPRHPRGPPARLDRAPRAHLRFRSGDGTPPSPARRPRYPAGPGIREPAAVLLRPAPASAAGSAQRRESAGVLWSGCTPC